MKSFLLPLFCFLTLSFGTLNAQTFRGKVLVGVASTVGSNSQFSNLSYTTTKVKSDLPGATDTDPSNTFGLNLLPKIGYFVADNFALGLDMNFAYSTTSDETVIAFARQSAVVVGPFVRAYIPTQKVLPFVEFSAAFGGSSVEVEFRDPFSGTQTFEDKSNLRSMGVGFGLAAPLGDKITFDALAFYNSSVSKRTENNPNEERTVSGSLGVRLGFTLLLGTGKI